MKSTEPLYEMSSIGRPLDPSYPTNRAVLFLMPIGAVLAGALSLVDGAGVGTAALRALLGAFAVLLPWALARELAPDDEIEGAFLALALGYGAWLWLDAALLPVVAALLFARMVVRSTGLAATGFDALAVTAVALFAAWRTGSPWPAAAGAVAFALDAVLVPRLARQWLFAGLCAAGAVGLVTAGLAPYLVPIQPGLVPRTAATVIMVGAIALIATTRSVAARGDATGEPLRTSRVRGGQMVALLTALAVAASGTSGIEAGAVIWASFAGVAGPAFVRGLRRGSGVA
ncbi:MAG: hypothetical protein PVF05_05290 [Gemmatimonadales bacterium]|jgi:hypothetical protein